jgi:chromosome segregation ATPase
MSTMSNDPESQNLSMDEVRIFEAARLAGSSLTKTFDLWMALALGIKTARDRADRIQSRTAFQRIIEQQGLAGFLGNTWNSQKSTANKLLAILERKAEVEHWRAGLTSYQRTQWAAPTTIFKHCPLFRNELDKIDRPAKGNGPKWTEGQVESLTKQVTDLESENAQLKSRIAELESELMVVRAQLAKEEHSDPALNAIASSLAAHGDELAPKKSARKSKETRSRRD